MLTHMHGTNIIFPLTSFWNNSPREKQFVFADHSSAGMELDGEINALGNRDPSWSRIIIESYQERRKEITRERRIRMRQTKFEISNRCKRLVDRFLGRLITDRRKAINANDFCKTREGESGWREWGGGGGRGEVHAGAWICIDAYFTERYRKRFPQIRKSRESWNPANGGLASAGGSRRMVDYHDYITIL